VKQIPFRVSDTGPMRTEQLSAMSAALCNHDWRLSEVEDAVVALGGSLGSDLSPDDPGDLTIYLENGLT
jgi:hypothetical protein